MAGVMAITTSGSYGPNPVVDAEPALAAGGEFKPKPVTENTTPTHSLVYTPPPSCVPDAPPPASVGDAYSADMILEEVKWIEEKGGTVFTAASIEAYEAARTEPVPEDATVIDIKPPTIKERTHTYTIEVDWTHTVSGAKGTDVFKITDTIHPDFWALKADVDSNL